MTTKKLIEKGKLWLVLHGLKEFPRMNCQDTKCKYVTKYGICSDHKYRKIIKGNTPEEICLTWLDDVKKKG